jgi:hypothetical protein
MYAQEIMLILATLSEVLRQPAFAFSVFGFSISYRHHKSLPLEHRTRINRLANLRCTPESDAR